MQNAVPLQLETCLSICSTIESLLLDSLGPNGLHTMLTTSSGNALISGDGHTIVTSLMLSHPVARWIVDHMKSHHIRTGDNAKSYVMILTEILRRVLHKEGGSVTNHDRGVLTELSNGLAELHSVILPDAVLPEIMKHAVVTDVTESNREVVKSVCLNLIRTSFAGKFNPQATNHMSELLCNFVLGFSSRLDQLDKSILHLLDNFEEVFLEVTNQSVTSSRASNGVIIARDFIHKAVGLNSLPEVKFILVGASFESYSPDSASTLSISSQSQLHSVLNYQTTRIQGVIRRINTKGVNLIISAESISDATLHECRRAGISVVHMVPEETLSHIAHCTSVRILHGPDDVIDESNIGTADFCDSTLLGSSKCIHLGLRSGSQLVICAPTKGMCRQWYTAVHNALKCLRVWLDHDQLPIVMAGFDETPAGRTKPDDAQSSTNADVMKEEGHFVETNNISNQRLPETKKTTLCGDHNQLQGFSVIGGGAVDILISQLLAEHSARPSTSLSASKACQVVSEAILSVPRTLHANSFIPKSARTSFIHVRNQIETEYRANGKLYGIDGRTGEAVDVGSQGVMEPAMAKCLLISDVVRTLQELLRIDTVLGVKGSVMKEINEDND